MAKAHGKSVIDVLTIAVAAIAVVSGPTTPEDGKRVLWAHASDDSYVPVGADGKLAAYGVFRSWGGETATDAPNIIEVQGYANGPTAAAALELLEKLYNALLIPDVDQEAPGAVRREWLIGSAPTQFVVSIFQLTPPALIGSDDQQRIDGAFNFSLGYRPA